MKYGMLNLYYLLRFHSSAFWLSKSRRGTENFWKRYNKQRAGFRPTGDRSGEQERSCLSLESIVVDCDRNVRLKTNSASCRMLSTPALFASLLGLEEEFPEYFVVLVVLKSLAYYN